MAMSVAIQQPTSTAVSSTCCSAKSVEPVVEPPIPPKTCCAGKKRKIEEVVTSPATDQKSIKKRSSGVIINGQTFTCASCRAGHRTALCKHAFERPMMPTNPPGRPAAGTKKGSCDCPKNCNCKKTSCKCPRDCACTQEMYLLVYVPDSEETRDSNGAAQEGTWKLGERVVTDLKGNTLTEEEIARRQAQKEAQKCCKSSKKGSRSPSLSVPPEQDCKEMPDVSQAQIQPVQSVPETPRPQQPQPLADHHCSCGAACACAFCPQHPNNSVSKGLVRQQAMHSTQQPFPQAQDFYRLDPSAVQFSPDRSCMGFKPSFAIGHYAMRPGAGEFQRAFPLAAGGYMLAYPMWEIEAMQNGMQQILTPSTSTPLPQSEAHISPSLDLQWSRQPSQYDFTSEEPLFDSTQNGLEVGNAFIARNDLGSWNDPFDLTASPSPLEFAGGSSLQTHQPFIPPADVTLPSLSHSASEDTITIPATPALGNNFHDPPLPTPEWEPHDFIDGHESTDFDLSLLHHPEAFDVPG